MNDTLVIRDVKTGGQFNVPKGVDRVTLKASDGARITIHPQVIQMFGYKRGQQFNGKTTAGTRQLVLVQT